MIVAENEKWNPGNHVLVWGMLAVCVFVIGGAVATPADAWPSPMLWWIAGVALVVVIFTASVVGAYCAGKRRS